MDRLPRKHTRRRQGRARARSSARRPDATFGIISVGGCDPAVREAVDVLGRARHRRRLHAHPRLPVRRRRSRRSWPRTIASSSSSRTATRSCASLLTLETGVAEGQAALGARLRRLPAVSRHVVDGDHRASSSGRQQDHAAHHETRRHPPAPRSRNKLGLTVRDYEGAMSTLCAGCGHDSVTAAIVRAFCELRHAAAHDRQAVAASAARRRRRPTSSAARTASTRRTAACRRSRPAPTPPTASSPTSASPATATRSRSASASCATPSAATSNMLYVIENNGVYGLTKGQFSASADVGSKSKRGEAEPHGAHRSRCMLALEPRRDLRRAQLLGRQGAARADPEGGARAHAASRSST